MRKHGLHPIDIMGLLDRKAQDSIADYERWHKEVFACLREKYEKPNAIGIGDKSPDFYRTPALCDHVISEHRLIYTIRDPRAVFCSIQADETSQIEKDRRWQSFLDNYRYWKRFLQQENLIVLRFEDLVAGPDEGMQKVCSHLGVACSDRYQRAFPRAFPERFLWKGVTEKADQGVHFSVGKLDRWKVELSTSEIQHLEKSREVQEIMNRFGYSCAEGALTAQAD